MWSMKPTCLHRKTKECALFKYKLELNELTHIDGSSSLRFRSIIGLGVCCMLFSRSPCSKNSEACNKIMYSYNCLQILTTHELTTISATRFWTRHGLQMAERSQAVIIIARIRSRFWGSAHSFSPALTSSANLSFFLTNTLTIQKICNNFTKLT